MGKKGTGEERNARGKCYMTPCCRKAITEVIYYCKKVKVCKTHEYVEDN